MFSMGITLIVEDFKRVAKFPKAFMVGAFLQNPGTLTVSATPEKPVNLMEIMLASQANPQELVKLLNVKAEASN